MEKYYMSVIYQILPRCCKWLFILFSTDPSVICICWIHNIYINFRKMPVLSLTKTNIRVKRGPCTRTIYVSLRLKIEGPKELGKRHSKNKPLHLIGWGRLVQVHQLGFLAEIHAYNANSVFSEQKKKNRFLQWNFVGSLSMWVDTHNLCLPMDRSDPVWCQWHNS